MRFLAYTHPSCFFIFPALLFVEHRCENEHCGELHGWSVELGWGYWSVVFEMDCAPPTH